MVATPGPFVESRITRKGGREGIAFLSRNLYNFGYPYHLLPCVFSLLISYFLK